MSEQSATERKLTQELFEELLKDANARLKAVQCPFALLYECYRLGTLHRLVSPNKKTFPTRSMP
jgi:hypothetical protein